MKFLFLLAEYHHTSYNINELIGLLMVKTKKTTKKNEKSNKINHPIDKFFGRLFLDKEIIIEFLTYLVKEDFVNDLDFSTLVKVDRRGGSQYDKDKTTDVLWKLKYEEGGDMRCAEPAEVFFVTLEHLFEDDKKALGKGRRIAEKALKQEQKERKARVCNLKEASISHSPTAEAIASLVSELYASACSELLPQGTVGFSLQ